MADLQQATKHELARIAEKKINHIHNDLLSHDNDQYHGRAVEAATGFLERAIAELEKTQGTNMKEAESMLERAITQIKKRPEYYEEKEIPLDVVSDFLEGANVVSFLSENNPGNPPSKKPLRGGRRGGHRIG